MIEDAAELLAALQQTRTAEHLAGAARRLLMDLHHEGDRPAATLREALLESARTMLDASIVAAREALDALGAKHESAEDTIGQREVALLHAQLEEAIRQRDAWEKRHDERIAQLKAERDAERAALERLRRHFDELRELHDEQEKRADELLEERDRRRGAFELDADTLRKVAAKILGNNTLAEDACLLQAVAQRLEKA